MAIAATTLVLHVAVFSLIDPPARDAFARITTDDAPDGEPVEGVGGTFVVSTNCMTDVFAGTVARMMSCYFPFVDDRNQCLGNALAWYRVGSVDCSTVDEVQYAEYDATELVDPDSIDLAMLETNIEKLLEDVKEKEIQERLNGQVVDTPKPLVEERPDDYEFLAEHDAKVEKQMVKHGTPGGTVVPRPPEPQPDVDPHEALEATPPSLSQPGGGALSMRAPGTPGTPEQDELPPGPAVGFESMSATGFGAMRGRQPTDRGPVGGGGENGAGEGNAGAFGGITPHNLRVTEDVMRKATGGTNDHLPGIEEGEFTALNTRKWKYASFFNRVKRQVAQNWHPEQVYRLRDPNGNIYGTKDRLTVLTVSLEPDGTLHKVVISEPSGVDFLDDEAVNAFELAQPFPNPPDGLVDRESHLITFRFGFSFEISSSTPWRIFRYR